MYGHPFYDLVHFLHVTRRQLPQEMQEKIKNTYLKQWETYGTGKDILRIYETVERLKDFFYGFSGCGLADGDDRSCWRQGAGGFYGQLVANAPCLLFQESIGPVPGGR